MKIDLCKLFGVEEGEEFRIKGICIDENSVYLIKNNMLCFKDKAPLSCLYVNDLHNISKIIKLPKKKEFTDDELCILRNADRRYKWIARDQIGDLCLFVEKPHKDEAIWVSAGNSENIEFYFFSHIFESIEFEDEEPVFIDDYVER